MLYDLLMLLVPLIAFVIAFLLYKYLKIQIDENRLKPIIISIINVIMQVEREYAGSKGEKKHQKATDIVSERLKATERNLVSRVFGSIGQATEWVFQTVVQPNYLLKKISERISK